MRAIILLAGIAMAAGFFLTWIEAPFAGPEFSPAAVLRESGVDIVEADWTLWVFLGGFAAAGLSALTSLVGRGSGLFALLAGLSPLVVFVTLYLRADDFLNDLGLPFPVDLSDLGQAWNLMSDFVRVGFWAYLGGAALLLIAGFSRLGGERR